MVAQPVADSWTKDKEPSAPELPPAVVEPEVQPLEEPTPAPEPPSALPAQVQQPAAEPQSTPAPAPAKILPVVNHTKPATPSLRSSAKYKITDQAVVMPSSTFGSGLEKVGMQFGSLSLGGDDLDSSVVETAPSDAPVARPSESVTLESPAPQQAIQPPAAAPAQVQEQPAPAVTSTPATQTSSASVPSMFQQAIPQQAQQQNQFPQQTNAQQQHALPSAISQTLQPSQSTASATSPYPLQSQVQSQQQQQPPQPPLTNHQQIPQNQTQVHSQHHQYVQHGLPTHLDPMQNQASTQLPQTSQQQSIGGPASYFRQPDAPYFHTPTPPAGQSQDGPYGAFGQLGQQVQHQAQASHLGGGFGANDYGYNDTQRVGSKDHSRKVAQLTRLFPEFLRFLQRSGRLREP